MESKIETERKLLIEYMEEKKCWDAIAKLSNKESKFLNANKEINKAFDSIYFGAINLYEDVRKGWLEDKWNAINWKISKILKEWDDLICQNDSKNTKSFYSINTNIKSIREETNKAQDKITSFK